MTTFESDLSSRERFKILVMGSGRETEFGELISRDDAERALKNTGWSLSTDPSWYHPELKLSAFIVSFTKPRDINDLPGTKKTMAAAAPLTTL